jgi:hypothetical protein
MQESSTDDLHVVRPVLSKQQAGKNLSIRAPLPPFRKVRFEKIELTYLPHYLFDVTVEWKAEQEVARAAIDAVLGHFAMWRPEGIEMQEAKEYEFEIPFIITPDRAREKLLAQYRWLLISTALKLRKRFRIIKTIPGPRLYYPFYAAYHRARGRWRFEACDAVSGMRQGGKVKDALLAGWLGSTREDKTE